jgi:hypothetical protein
MATPASRFRAVPNQVRAELPLRLPPNLVVAPRPDVDRSLRAYVVDGPSPALPNDRRPEEEAVVDPNAIEIDRVVPTSGNLKVARQQFWLGPRLAGHAITLWIDTKTVHVSIDGRRLKTVPSRLLEPDLERLRRNHLRGARIAGPTPATGVPIRIRRRTSVRGAIFVATQRVQVGLIHSRKVVTVELYDTVLRVIESDGEILKVVPSHEHEGGDQHKAHGHDPRARG